MMKSKEALAQLMKERLVPLFNNPDGTICRKVVKICYEAGIRVFEFPDRFDNALEIFRALRSYCNLELPGMLLGAGTMKTARQAELFIEAGADFMISPSIPAEVGSVCRLNDVLWIPGCATPTEINIAENQGIEYVKVFPARQLGGPAFIKAMKGPFPGMKFMASGGVTTSADDLREWFAAGVSNVAIASELFRKEFLSEENLPRLQERIGDMVSILSAFGTAKQPA